MDEYWKKMKPKEIIIKKIWNNFFKKNMYEIEKKNQLEEGS